MLDSITLQSPEVIPVAQLAKQLLEDCPVTVPTGRPELAFEMTPEIGLDAVVVQQRIVHIDEEDGLVRRDH